MDKLYSKFWHDLAIKQKQAGITNRQISRNIWGFSDNESKLRKFFKRPDVRELLGEKAMKEDKIKVLFWDIETLPSVSFHWDHWGVNIPIMSHTISDGFMLSHAWSWGVDGEIHSSILTPEEVLAKDDSRLVLEMHSLFQNADVIVAHNGKKFDVKKANAAFLKLGLKPPKPYKVIDTVKIAKKFFSLPSYSLAYLCKALNLPHQKIQTEGFSLWRDCFYGDPAALKTMETYNRGDIPTLVALYLKLRPWGNDGVNFSALSGGTGLICPNCGGSDTFEESTVPFGNKLSPVHRCNTCGANARLVITKSKDYLTKL